MKQRNQIPALLTLLFIIAKNPSRLHAAAFNQDNTLEKAVGTVAGAVYISHQTNSLTDQNQPSPTNNQENNPLCLGHTRQT